jgi:hypothetical protein
VKGCVDFEKRVAQLQETNRTPLEFLKAIKADEALWKVFVQLYPELKDAKDEQAIVEKINRQELFDGLDNRPNTRLLLR